ncbi:unnamed protein product [Adineta ricciae]|uniref:Uncharacterized protein n=1 Tax=Adineta ricciae TaxID=249248 RepID=A0A815XVB0_ADIRI|nr:unnamed protein product [Adineta ricciae]
MPLDENDPLVSLLHVIQRRSNLDKSIENDSIQTNVDYDTKLQNIPSTKSVPCRNFAALENKRSRKKPKQLTDNPSLKSALTNKAYETNQQAYSEPQQSHTYDDDDHDHRYVFAEASY